MRGKVVLGLMLTLLLIGILTLTFNVQPVKTLATATVTYDYYVVAGNQMEPTPPSPASSPTGFNFTVDPPVFNFGNVTYWGGRSYLYDGFAYSPYYYTHNTTGARFNITNLLAYDINITELTAEVTNGTITKIFFFPPANQWIGNWTIVGIDTLDPGEYDECDYFSGVVEVQRLNDGDRHHKTVGDSWQPLWIISEPSLLEPDQLGDANATGHVASKYGGSPITLATGETFTEYFGVIIAGNADRGTQINGTITLSLTYEYELGDCSYPKPSFTFTPANPAFNETVTFDASASMPGFGNITCYSWNFGDGVTDAGVIVNHTYATPGTYEVILNVTDSLERWVTRSESVTVIAPAKEEFPWLWIGVGLIIAAAVAAAVIIATRRRK